MKLYNGSVKSPFLARKWDSRTSFLCRKQGNWSHLMPISGITGEGYAGNKGPKCFSPLNPYYYTEDLVNSGFLMRGYFEVSRVYSPSPARAHYIYTYRPRSRLILIPYQKDRSTDPMAKKCVTEGAILCRDKGVVANKWDHPHHPMQG